MRQVKQPVSRHHSVSILVLFALMLASLPVLAGCQGGETDDQVLLDHSGRNPDSIYRHHHN